MAIYKPINDSPISAVSEKEKVENQRIPSGTDPEYLSEKGIFYLDTLIVGSGVEISDGLGNSIGSGITSFSLNNNHIRLDYGIKITGSVILAKGYVVENVFLK
jgi:hypothetical protein